MNRSTSKSGFRVLIFHLLTYSFLGISLFLSLDQQKKKTCPDQK